MPPLHILGRKHRFGKWHTVKVVHEGDKSSVFLVECDPPDCRRAAIKLYQRIYDRTAARLEKKYDMPSEAEVGRSLNHPEGPHPRYPIVHTIEGGREFAKRTGRRYIVQEFIEGVALKRLVTCRDRRVLRYPAAFMLQTCKALRVMHQAGFVYRDLCTQNLIVQPDNILKIIDLGFVAPADIAYEERSGTPSYMSPEQITAQPLDPRTDIYSLGIVLYELLRMRLPYEPETEGEDEASLDAQRGEVMVKHLEADVPELPETIRRRRPQLAEIMTRCLQKDPEDRFQSVDEIMDLYRKKS
jgi:serine/threonine protein kinase